MVKIELKNISKSYGKSKILDNINLEIHDKEYFIILSPTGAGKTTLLKVIAGLIQPDSGEVYFDGKDVTNKPANERNLGYVFENYALFPHLNVFKNICYSGRVKARDTQLTKDLADQILMMTLLKGRSYAMPTELSGGMQQRVAISRALMNLESTGLLILDEPFKALDAGLRMNLRREIREMAKSKFLQLTVVHVTNEMEEAMMVADRIALLKDGKLNQVGTPYEIYYRPVDLFTANFLSEINYFEGECVKDKMPTWNIYKDPKPRDNFFEKIYEDSHPIPVDLGLSSMFAAYGEISKIMKISNREPVILVVRSNHFKIRLGDRTKDKNNSFLGKIVRRKFMGVEYRFEVSTKIKDQEKIIIITIPATSEIHRDFLEGETVTAYFPKELGIVFKHPGQEELKKIIHLQ